jgi:hypothetical protein
MGSRNDSHPMRRQRSDSRSDAKIQRLRNQLRRKIPTSAMKRTRKHRSNQLLVEGPAPSPRPAQTLTTTMTTTMARQRRMATRAHHQNGSASARSKAKTRTRMLRNASRAKTMQSRLLPALIKTRRNRMSRQRSQNKTFGTSTRM